MSSLMLEFLLNSCNTHTHTLIPGEIQCLPSHYNPLTQMSSKWLRILPLISFPQTLMEGEKQQRVTEYSEQWKTVLRKEVVS